MNKYLTTKLAEEASEVAQAACKVLLHQDKQSRGALLSEAADVQAMLELYFKRLSNLQQIEFKILVADRIKREKLKGKA